MHKIISNPMLTRSSGVRARTVAWLPTGKKTGVCTLPCYVVSAPQRALVLWQVDCILKWRSAFTGLPNQALFCQYLMNLDKDSAASEKVSKVGTPAAISFDLICK